MRRLLGIIRTQVTRARFKPDKVYGGTYTEMARYLVDKYGIQRAYVHSMLYDIFRYIEMETMSGPRGIFTVPRFGRFERREIQHGEGTESTSSIVMRFTRSAVRRGGTYVDFEDEEWVDE